MVRIVSFNAHYGENLCALTESIRASSLLRDAQVLLIQEIEAHQDEGSSRARQLAAALRCNYVYAPARHRKGGTHGLAILSRFPLSDFEVMPLPRYKLLINTRSRIALGATLDVAGHPLLVYNVHLDTRINVGERIRQLQPVLKAAQGQSLEATVIGGDFNTNPLRWLFHLIPLFPSNQAGALDEFMRAKGFGTPLSDAGVTARRKFPRERLDSLFTQGVSVQASGVDRTVKSSDHYPVWIDVSWPPSPHRQR